MTVSTLTNPVNGGKNLIYPPLPLAGEGKGEGGCNIISPSPYILSPEGRGNNFIYNVSKGARDDMP
jgi:hypothetical protein